MSTPARIAIKGPIAAAIAAPGIGVSTAAVDPAKVIWTVEIDVVAAPQSDDDILISYEQRSGAWDHLISVRPQ